MDNLNYGIIGNCRSAALISETGNIEWCCLPYFDSASVFAALLDKKKGGSFCVKPVGQYKISQSYYRRTNILVTRYSDGKNIFELYDFMPRYKKDNGKYHLPPDVIRFVKVCRGRPVVKVIYNPQPGYAQGKAVCEANHEYIKHHTSSGKYESVYLYSDIDHQAIVNQREVELTGNCYFMLSYNQKIAKPDIDWVELELERTKVYWMEWVARTTVFPKYQKEIKRSALVLKLLAYQKTGAILAAATTSLPETIGEVRNWDYRYCWLRDASMTINILARLGHFNVAKRFLNFVLDIVPYKDEKIQIMYGIHNQKKLTEMELPWLEGYMGSRPVRIGNAAYKQKQNDIYGILLDVIYQSFTLFRSDLDNMDELWTVVRTLARHIHKNWKKPDRGIWEFRSERRHFTFSKILCWVGMDRAEKIAELFAKQNDAKEWARLRDEIRTDIMKNGVDPEMGVLVQSYGSKSMDASNLLALHYGFFKADDKIYRDTVARSYDELCRNGLMYRYKTSDDFGVPRSSFTVCTFWMIRALFETGQVKKAHKLFRDLLRHSNHLGLFSEDMDFESKRLLGNFPQGYSHIALIDTAMRLCEAEEDAHGPEPWERLVEEELIPEGHHLQPGPEIT